MSGATLESPVGVGPGLWGSVVVACDPISSIKYRLVLPPGSFLTGLLIVQDPSRGPVEFGVAVTGVHSGRTTHGSFVVAASDGPWATEPFRWSFGRRQLEQAEIVLTVDDPILGDHGVVGWGNLLLHARRSPAGLRATLATAGRQAVRKVRRDSFPRGAPRGSPALVHRAGPPRADRPGSRTSETPQISIITPVHDTDPGVLHTTADAVLRQSYGGWQWCMVDDSSSRADTHAALREIAEADDRITVARRTHNGGIVAASNDAIGMATGSHIALLDHDDVLAPSALERVVDAIREAPDAGIVYTDEVRVTSGGEAIEVVAKPDWSPDRLRSGMYLGHLTVYARSLLDEVGWFAPGTDGSQDYDLALRASERCTRIVHVREVLYQWRSVPTSIAAHADAKPWAFEAGRRALQAALDRSGPAGRALPGIIQGTYRARYAVPDGTTPLIVVVAEADTSPGAIERSVRGIARATPRSFDVALVVHGTDQAIEAERCARSQGIDIRTVTITGDETWHAAVHSLVTSSRSTHVMLLDADVEVLTSGTIQSLLEAVQPADVSVAAGNVFTRTGSIQASGQTVRNGRLADAWSGAPRFAQTMDLVCIHDVAAADRAILTPTEVFLALGGFAIGGSLSTACADYCFKVREAGGRVVVTPFAEFAAHGGAARRSAREATELLARWPQYLRHDPFRPS